MGTAIALGSLILSAYSANQTRKESKYQRKQDEAAAETVRQDKADLVAKETRNREQANMRLTRSRKKTLTGATDTGDFRTRNASLIINAGNGKRLLGA